MNPIIIISIISLVIVLLLTASSAGKYVKFVGQACIKVLIGALFLFFLNAFGSYIGLHVPINLLTSSISGFLGIPGVLALACIQLWIL
ncbi:pro-sigmaK processing inhibitor BofA family protein [Aeribacillus pallidus]|uniref:pro-sigmaK processing inhibitor BofA family protein n=1 Tax=Aeribacillus pallidus TaxID=33936 RepID=UPI001D77CF95|nr:pro-sigmaK processing inhibitor BofA family protein [Bacillus sp. (in: firmicutes)]